jgi:hypothetical protein
MKEAQKSFLCKTVKKSMKFCTNKASNKKKDYRINKKNESNSFCRRKWINVLLVLYRKDLGSMMRTKITGCLFYKCSKSSKR